MPAIYIPPAVPDPRLRGYYPRRTIGAVSTRRASFNLKVAQGLAAASCPAAATAYPWLCSPFYAQRADTLVLFLTATAAVSGTPSGVQAVVLAADGLGNMAAVPGSPFALTLVAGAAAGVLAAPLLIQNAYDQMAVGLQAAVPWSGGTLMLCVKERG